MLWDIILLILGVILGIITPKVYNFVKLRIHKSQTSKRISLLGNNQKIYNWLNRYYIENDNKNDLFDCKIKDLEIKIPFLSKQEWQYFQPIPYEKDVLLEFTQTIRQDFSIDHDLIKRRRGLGQILFNNPVLYLDRIEEKQPSLLLHVKSCDFFQLATPLMSLEEETFQAIQKDSIKHLPIRDSYIASLSQVQRLPKEPYGIGCSVALAIKTKESYDLLIHTRSFATFTFGGSKAVTPNFALAPIIGSTIGQMTETTTTMNSGNYKIHNILYYNFIREYLEELYNYEELVNLVESRKAYPFWFYDLPEARKLIELIEQGSFNLEFLGFGFDTLNGNAVIALLGIINDINFSSEFRRDLELNWEIGNQNERIDIEFVDIQSASLEQWHREYKFHTGAAFTIARALTRLGI